MVKEEYEKEGWIVHVDLETSPAMFCDVFYYINKFIEENKITVRTLGLEDDDDEVTDKLLKIIDFDNIVEYYRNQTEGRCG